MATVEAIEFQSSGAALRGLLYLPDGSMERRVILCDPLFEERKSSARIMTETAQALAAAGCGVLRFDYRGCGDSDGDFPEFTVRDWTDDIARACDFMAGRTAAAPLGLLGLRLGATFAARYALQSHRPEFLVLWEPATQGRAYLADELRKKLVKEMMTFGKSRASRDSLLQDLRDGKPIDFDGYAVSPSLHAALDDLDLTSAAGAFDRRVLCVQIGPQEQPSRQTLSLQQALQTAGAAVDVLVQREKPFWNLIGLVSCPTLIRESVDWITGSRCLEGGKD